MSRVFSLTGGQLIVNGDDTVAPGDICTFLTKRGWSMDNSYWKHTGKGRYNMTWEQAIACEFYEFITIGGVR